MKKYIAIGLVLVWLSSILFLACSKPQQAPPSVDNSAQIETLKAQIVTLQRDVADLKNQRIADQKAIEQMKAQVAAVQQGNNEIKSLKAQSDLIMANYQDLQKQNWGGQLKKLQDDVKTFNDQTGIVYNALPSINVFITQWNQLNLANTLKDYNTRLIWLENHFR